MTSVLVVSACMIPTCGLVIVDVVLITFLDIRLVSVTVTSDSVLMILSRSSFGFTWTRIKEHFVLFFHHKLCLEGLF